MRALLGSKADLLEQTGLADAGLADQLDSAWPPAIQIVQDALDAAELVQAPHELGSCCGSTVEPPFRLGMPRDVRSHLQCSDITTERLLLRLTRVNAGEHFVRAPCAPGARPCAAMRAGCLGPLTLRKMTRNVAMRRLTMSA